MSEVVSMKPEKEPEKKLTWHTKEAAEYDGSSGRYIIARVADADCYPYWMAVYDPGPRYIERWHKCHNCGEVKRQHLGNADTEVEAEELCEQHYRERNQIPF
jgi:ribosomal protein L32